MSGEIVQSPEVSRIVPLDIPMVNMQVETANKYPRQDLAVISNKIEGMLAADKELSAMCYYAKPVGKDKDGKMKFVQGASVRLAEIIASEYGNLLVQVDAEENATGVVALCRVYDAQKNFAVQSPVKRAFTSQRDQAKQNTYNAATSIAFRNGIFKVVPKAMAEKLWKAAREVAEKEIGDPGKKRGAKKRHEDVDKMVTTFANVKVTMDMLLEFLAIDDIYDISAQQYADLRGYYTAIKNGDSDVGEFFRIPPTSGGSKINERPASDDDKELADAFPE